MRIQHLVIVSALLTCGCETTRYGGLRQDEWAKLNLCGGGSSQSISASLKYEIAKDIRSGNVSAAVAQEIKTAILSSAELPAADREKAYEDYLYCVNHIRVPPHP